MHVYIYIYIYIHIETRGFKDKIKFNPDYKSNISKNSKRKRKIICFNPPYSSNVSTNIGKRVLTILDRDFPKSHKLHKIFNRNNVRISYIPCLILVVLSTHTKRLSIVTSQNSPHQHVIAFENHPVL